MQEIVLSRLADESLEQCLWRLGSVKKSGTVDVTWDQIADFLNSEFDLLYGESAYRKRYKRLVKAAAVKQLEAVYEKDYEEKTKINLRELEKQRIRIREERNLYNKNLRTQAQTDALFDELKEAIQKVEQIEPEIIEYENANQAMYAMLSDIHYGMSFTSYYSNYSPEIAQKRVMTYANELIKIGEQNRINDIYVAVLGDLISGNIHPTIRLENRGTAISQVIGVSELISSFLYELSKSFTNVYVSNVSGNHSRLDANPDQALRSERLDALIPWYCKAKLENISNVHFKEKEVDPTIDVCSIFGKTYVSVHGDFDPDLKTSATRISQLIDKKIDYFLAGHMHVADMRIEDIGYIRNGAVVTGGDEYTTKKRLFGPAVQVALLCSKNGVDAICPIRLS